MVSNNGSGNQHQEKDNKALRVTAKALLVFIVFNLLFYLSSPLPVLGRLSAYNILFPGRTRLPYGDNPHTSYNLSPFNLDAMLASHELSGSVKDQDEFRVILIGDSAAWGFLLSPEQTLSAYLNKENITLPDGKHLRAYNLGYPVMSLTKDLLFLDRAMQYEPDLILWPLTLESFPKDKQLFPPLLVNNPKAVRQLIDDSGLDHEITQEGLKEPGFWDRTIVGARRSLADLVRLQLYGVMWAATGIDHEIPENYTPRMEDLPQEVQFHEYHPPHLDSEQLAFGRIFK